MFFSSIQNLVFTSKAQPFCSGEMLGHTPDEAIEAKSHAAQAGQLLRKLPRVSPGGRVFSEPIAW